MFHSTSRHGEIAKYFLLLRPRKKSVTAFVPVTLGIDMMKFAIIAAGEGSRLAEEGVGAFAENARCAELLNLLRQRQREAMLLLAGGAALLCLLLVTVGMYLRRSSGFHARGGRLPSFRKEESEKS